MTHSGGGKRSSLKDIKSRLFQCGICMGEIVGRKEMPCGHNFCMKCFQEKCKRGNASTEEECPKCSVRSRIPSYRGWKLFSPRGVSTMPGGRYARVENVEGTIQIYNADGMQFVIESQFKARQKLESGKFSCPWDVAIDKDGIYYVTDSTPFVNVYDDNGKFVRQFFTRSPGYPASNDKEEGDFALCGIALNNYGQLYVGEINEKYISLLRTNGAFLSSFPVEVKPKFLAITPKGDIVVSACEGRVAVIVDENGKEKCKIPTPTGLSSWCPTGVACTKKGELFVANRLGEVGIYRYTSEGKYLGLVTKNVITPWGMAISEDDKFLFVADEHDIGYFDL